MTGPTIKILAAKPKNPSSIPTAHTAEEQNGLHKLSSDKLGHPSPSAKQVTKCDK